MAHNLHIGLIFSSLFLKTNTKGGQTMTPKEKAIQMNSFRQELVELYMQGWLDRDWKIGEDDADEKAEKLADALMAKYKL